MKKTLKVLLCMMFLVAIPLTLMACGGKTDYDMSSISFEDATYVYDGTEKKLEISGSLPSGVSVSYSNNTLTNVGEIEVTAKFSGDSNHNSIPDRKATLKITKATYDMSNVTFTDKTYVYDGTEKRLEISGTLPNGVSVNYSTNTLTDAGEITVTAEFTGDSVNYYSIPNKTAKLKVVNDGSYHNVRFFISDTESILRVVKHGGSVTDIPTPKENKHIHFLVGIVI